MRFDTAIRAVYLERMPPNAEAFWYGGLNMKYAELVDIIRWEYGTTEYYVKQGLHMARSLPLLMRAPELLYPGSRRPQNDMAMFRGPRSPTVSPEELEPAAVVGFPSAMRWKGREDDTILLPVTRYAVGMGGSLYYAGDGEGVVALGAPATEKWCGTFYYAEPESTTLLRLQRCLVARNKVAAVHALEVWAELPISPLLDMFDTATNYEPHHLAFQHPWLPAGAQERLDKDIRYYNEHVEDYEALLARQPGDKETPEIQRARQELDLLRPNTLEYFPGARAPFRQSRLPWSPAVAEYLLRVAEGVTTKEIPRDLQMTPGDVYEAIAMPEWSARSIMALGEDELNGRRYAGRRLHMYATEDFLDQYLCELAHTAGYDVVLLEGIPGYHQVVAEVLDVRPRVDSFDALVYVVGGGVV